MDDKTAFTKRLIKGEIAQVIFQQMFIEMDTAIVIPFGYEYTATVLNQFQKGMDKQDRQDLINVRNMPDFLLVSQKKDHAMLVEVKYRKSITRSDLKKLAKKVYDRWPSTWLFLACWDGFYFERCSKVKDKGTIKPLSYDAVPQKRQLEYLNILQSFIGEN